VRMTYTRSVALSDHEEHVHIAHIPGHINHQLIPLPLKPVKLQKQGPEQVSK